ncbi:DNA-binding transcriptional regulator, MerR family [Fontimonas thermophila]|uniref:DNA-binding transcriptional regulator, MerR family n=1 Tax=Fontimonas thermophila TaxID=1076937 RepID=A0A1I2I6S9_9GAMM|nr:MerR family transcriptional regulator [Fontimonas thermophila]SFF38012.1 DNA-binding transcriptional regulator, MerR family [Fontimonas thermophila]
MSPADSKPLPEIPRKRYFAIGEVSALCEVKPHVLRYWEQEFPQLRPVKRRGNRRYYQQEDVLMVRRIRSLLYEQGFTIGGARQRLKEMGKAPTPVNDHSATASANSGRPVSNRAEEIKKLRDELESLLRMLPD